MAETELHNAIRKRGVSYTLHSTSSCSTFGNRVSNIGKPSQLPWEINIPSHVSYKKYIHVAPVASNVQVEEITCYLRHGSNAYLVFSFR